MKNSFLMYHEYREILEDLTNEELGILFRAILDYEIDGVEPNFTGMSKMAFKVIKGNLDRDSQKYDKRCETSSENGKLGGRPKTVDSAKTVTLLKQGMSVTDVSKLTGASKRQIYRIQAELNSVPKPNQNLKKPKKPDNDNDTETDNENDNDTDAETDSDVNADFAEPEASETNADLFAGEDESETSADLFSFIEEAFGRTLNSIEYEVISGWEDNDLTRYAVKESILNGARGIRYIQTVLSSWEAKGFKTVQDVQAYQRKYNKTKFKQQEKEPPEWFDKKTDNVEMTDSEKEELDNLLKEMGG